jgi:hypothetical protein
VARGREAGRRHKTPDPGATFGQRLAEVPRRRPDRRDRARFALRSRRRVLISGPRMAFAADHRRCGSGADPASSCGLRRDESGLGSEEVGSFRLFSTRDDVARRGRSRR